MKKVSNQSGFGTLELIIAAGILLVVVTSVSAAFYTFHRFSNELSHDAQAALLLEEGLEALQIMRDYGWTANIASADMETPYSVHWDGNAYVLSEDLVLINNAYLREVEFHEVRRNGSGVLSAGGSVDNSTRRAVVTVYLEEDMRVLGTVESLIHNSYE